MAGALVGIRIVDQTQAMAGPFASMLLAAPVLGADLDAVLANLGYSAAEVAALRARKVV